MAGISRAWDSLQQSFSFKAKGSSLFRNPFIHKELTSLLGLRKDYVQYVIVHTLIIFPYSEHACVKM